MDREGTGRAGADLRCLHGTAVDRTCSGLPEAVFGAVALAVDTPTLLGWMSLPQGWIAALNAPLI